jgi:hypothetical protein
LRLSTGDGLSESRTGKRFPLNLPITIRQKKTGKGTSGLTSNVSAAGVYIQASSHLEVGTTIEFDIKLPAEIVGTQQDVEIVCKGRVVRMDDKSKHSKKGGIACVIDHYRFVRKKEKEAAKGAGR